MATKPPHSKVSVSSQNIGINNSKSKTQSTTSQSHAHLQKTGIIPEDILIEKSKKWRQFNLKKFASQRKYGYVEGEKEKLPHEVLRKIIKDHEIGRAHV